MAPLVDVVCVGRVGRREVLPVAAATLLWHVAWLCGGWRETNGAGVERGCYILRSNTGKRKWGWQHVEQAWEVRSAMEEGRWRGMVADRAGLDDLMWSSPPAPVISAHFSSVVCQVASIVDGGADVWAGRNPMRLRTTATPAGAVTFLKASSMPSLSCPLLSNGGNLRSSLLG
jgi:hypothetical protein